MMTTWDPCLRLQGPCTGAHSGQGSVSQALLPPPVPTPLLSCSPSSSLSLLLWLLGLSGTRALSNECAQPGNSVATLTGGQLGRHSFPTSEVPREGLQSLSKPGRRYPSDPCTGLCDLETLIPRPDVKCQSVCGLFPVLPGGVQAPGLPRASK